MTTTPNPDSISVPYDKLTLSDPLFQNPRTQAGLDEASLAELAGSIREHGLMYPLLARELPNGTYLVLGGQRRYLALGRLIEEGHLNGAAIPIVLRSEDTPEGMLVESLVDSIHRADLSTYELAQAIAELADALPQTEIARRIGRSEPYVSRLLKAHREAHGALRRAWERGELSIDAVTTLADTPRDEQDAAAEHELQHREVSKRKGSHGRPGVPQLRTLLEYLDASGKLGPYECGVRDGLRFVLGEIAREGLALGTPKRKTLEATRGEAR